MKATHIRVSILFALLVLLPLTARPVEPAIRESKENRLRVNLSSDLVSRYIWRGTDFGSSPSIQPTLSLSGANFEAGCWSAFATNNSFRELDLYLKYTFKGITLCVTDYYVPEIGGAPASPDPRYFVYTDQTTAHTVEASLQWKGGEKLPLWISGNIFLYGNDKRWGFNPEKDTLATTYYSAYLEAGYSLALRDDHLDLFAGFTPSAGAFGNAPGLVNIGITAYRTLKISDSLSLPLRGSLIFNPQASKAYFVLGITI